MVGVTLDLRLAVADDRERIYRMRHEVYAEELGQHPTNGDGRLSDALDERNTYIVATIGGELTGFVSVTPPSAGRYSVDKYLPRDQWPLPVDDGLFEVRILTVRRKWRHTPAAALLMYAALRWIAAQGGRRVVAIGRTEVLRLYLSAGLRPLGRTVRSGAVTFELMLGDVPEIAARAGAGRYAALLRRLEPGLRWELAGVPFRPGPAACPHGGASFDAIGSRFDRLDRRRDVVAADVLDAWFPPAPGALAALTDAPAWVAHTSPPTGADGLIAEIAQARGVPESAVAVGAGSSDLVFRAFRGWLRPTDRVLLLDPTYGEYAHVVEQVVGCRADRLPLRRADGWALDLDRLRTALRTGYDLVVLVNPNNPTGRHVDATALRSVLADAPPRTRIWVDEAYVEYAGRGRSLEPFAAASPNVVVCKSMSKVYALSGLRAAYLVGPPAEIAGIRRWTPPWPVSLPAQIAAVRALADPAYYAACWRETGALRASLAAALSDAVSGASPGARVTAAVGNFVLLDLPAGGSGEPEWSGGPGAAAELVRRCREHGVFLRDLSPLSASFGGRTVRVAVRGPEENTRIVAAVRAVLQSRVAGTR
jgi:histidinol-phosphate/aromatic aminotransferase/cobyric acid decarboxylase-like protein/N-acyl-L-homoserine lactone synthetase